MKKLTLEFSFVDDTFSLEVVDGRETEEQRKQREEKQAARDRAAAEKLQAEWLDGLWDTRPSQQPSATHPADRAEMRKISQTSGKKKEL